MYIPVQSLKYKSRDKTSLVFLSSLEFVAVAKYMHNSENHYIIQCIVKRSCQAARSREGISLFFPS